MELEKVSKDVFDEFIKKHKLKKEVGNVMHSYNFVDSDNKICAYTQSSSWSSNVIYRISNKK
jgi:hypothetical protein